MDEQSTQWQTRETLLNKIKNKQDDKAWEDFTFYYRDYIYNIIIRMNVKHHDAEEIVQDVILKAWNKLPEFVYDASKGRFRGWLCRVTGNAVKDFFRKKKQNVTNLSKQELTEQSNYLDRINLPEIKKIAEQEWKSYISKMAWENIENVFEEKVKKCFIMLTEGKNPKSICKNLGIAQGTVYVYKQRVVEKLQSEIIRLESELN